MTRVTAGTPDWADDLNNDLDGIEDLAQEAVDDVAAEAALARNADNLTSGTVADARIASTIARDSEVTAAVAAEAALARDGDNITAGTVADARIAATIARDSEVTAAVAAEATLARNADNLTSGTVVDARVASTIARDSEVTAAIAASEANNQIIADRIATGQEVFSRGFASTSAAVVSGQLTLSYFTAYRSETIAKLASYAGTTAAGATPTLCKMGLYTVDPGTGDITLVASTANTTSLWSAVSTRYETALSASYAVTAGTRYAFATLCITAATLPHLVGRLQNVIVTKTPPRISGAVNSQTDLPASLAAASILESNNNRYGELIP